MIVLPSCMNTKSASQLAAFNILMVDLLLKKRLCAPYCWIFLLLQIFSLSSTFNISVFCVDEMVIRPAKKFCMATLQTPLKFLGQNLFGDQFWGWSEAGKVCPKSTLGPGTTPLSAPGPRIAWEHTFPASDQPQNWSPIRFWPKNLSVVWSVTMQKFSAGLVFMNGPINSKITPRRP